MTAAPAPWRVLLADDHPVVLAGLRALLAEAGDVALAGETRNGEDALRLIRAERPDVAVIDISMPGMDGIELARAVAASCPEVRLLALTAHEDRAFVQQMLRAGARGYLLKRSAAEELLRAIRAVVGGGVFLDPAVAGSVLPEAAPPAEPSGALSQREKTVLRFLAKGLSNKEVAAELEISTKTVETYKARAMEKLRLRTRADIVRYATSQNWFDGDAGPVPG